MITFATESKPTNTSTVPVSVWRVEQPSSYDSVTSYTPALRRANSGLGNTINGNNISGHINGTSNAISLSTVNAAATAATNADRTPFGWQPSKRTVTLPMTTIHVS
jgi:hypothetical protein